MKTMNNKVRRIVSVHVFSLLAILFSGQVLMAAQVDLGIFTVGANQIQVKIKPDVLIPNAQTIGEIRYTIRYPDNPAVSITTLNAIAPYNVAFDAISTSGGYKYQTFVAPAFALGTTINAGQEVLISSFVYTGGGLADFALVNPGVGQNYYFEVICGAVDPPICPAASGQTDVTGIFYAPMATIPLSNWAIAIGIALMVGFGLFFMRKRIF